MSAARMAAVRERPFEDGTRVGRYLLLRDVDGTMHAVSATAVPAMCEIDDGTLLMLPGGKMLRVARPLMTVLSWLDGR